MKQLKTLVAWQCAHELARLAYRLTLEPPLCKHFGLADQIRRAAVSVPANMVEGYALGTAKQFLRALRIALGSAAELETHLTIARDLKLVEPSAADPTIMLCNRVIRLLIGLNRRIAARRARSPFPSPHSPVPITRRGPVTTS